MRREEAIKFIADNKEIFKTLGNKVRQLDTVRISMSGKDKYMIEMYGRKRAIEIIEEWIRELWGIAYVDDLPQTEEEDDIYHIITKKPERDLE